MPLDGADGGAPKLTSAWPAVYPHNSICKDVSASCSEPAPGQLCMRACARACVYYLVCPQRLCVRASACACTVYYLVCPQRLCARASACAQLHVPKLSVPTGMSADGRPTGLQLWGRAVPYEHMFDDACSTRHSVYFLHLAARAVEAIHADATLRPVPPIICTPPLA